MSEFLGVLRYFFVSQLTADPPRLAEYQEYLEHEETEGDPARIQCLYERAIQENCLNQGLWLKYIKYLVSFQDFVCFNVQCCRPVLSTQGFELNLKMLAGQNCSSIYIRMKND